MSCVIPCRLNRADLCDQESTVETMENNSMTMQVRSWVGKIPWRRAWQHTPARFMYNMYGAHTYKYLVIWGFSGSSAGIEPACNAGDPGLIPGFGKIPWRRDRLPTPDSWASLVAQMVKNPTAMWEAWVQSLGQEGPLEKGMTTHSSTLAWRIPMDRGAWQATVHGVAKSQTRLSS